MKKASMLLLLVALAAMAAASAPQAALAVTCEEDQTIITLRYTTQTQCETAGRILPMKFPTGGNWVLISDLTNRWRVNGSTITGNLNLLAKANTVDAVLKAEPLGIKTEILCEKVEVLAGSTIGVTGSGVADIAFNTCIVNKPAGCKVKQPIETNANETQEGGESTNKVYFDPPEGSTFVSITLEGCLVAGTYKVEGQQLCESSNLSTEAALHELSCVATASELEVGGLPATEEVGGIDLELESGETWSS